jgi:hypothetical protein
VVRDLLHVKRNASHTTLASLSEDGVEGLADFGVAGKYEAEGQENVLYLLLDSSFFKSLVHENRHKAEDPGETLKSGVVIEDLHGQSHAHDALARPQISEDLLDDQLENALLQLKFLLICKDILFRVCHLPARTQRQKVGPFLQVEVRLDIRFVFDFLRKSFFKIVLLVHPLGNYVYYLFFNFEVIVVKNGVFDFFQAQLVVELLNHI